MSETPGPFEREVRIAQATIIAGAKNGNEMDQAIVAQKEKEKNMNEAQEHIDKNTVKYDRKEGESLRQFVMTLRRRCVDGRHTPEQAANSFAFAGADLGIVMALSRATKGKLSPVEAYKAVSKALNKLGSSFFAHTDTHAEHDEHHQVEGVCFGCGHGKKATTQLASEYGVDPVQQAEVIELIKSEKIEEGMAPVDIISLDGDHKEKAVLVVNSENYTVNPMDGETQYFVYDLKLIQEYMKIIWDQLVEDGAVANDEKLKEAFMASEGAQRDITVRELATNQGKPTLLVTETDNRLVAGEMPQAA